MDNFQAKKKKFKFIHSLPFLFIISVFFIIFVVGVFSLFLKMQETNKNKENARLRLEELENRKEKLLLDIEGLTTNKGQEKLFRESYGFAKEGEGVVIVVDEDKKTNITNEPINKGFIDNFLDIFR